jgi:RNA polymerase sigma-70 factor (ECF subfamily)
MVLLSDQDRDKWDREQIADGLRLLRKALCAGRIGSYGLEAAIAAVHAEARRFEDTDWTQIVGLYERLLALHPSPIVALNHAAAVSMATGPAAALPFVDALSGELSEYSLWHSARADILRRLGRIEDAIASYERAHALSQNEVERRFLKRKIAELRHGQ